MATPVPLCPAYCHGAELCRCYIWPTKPTMSITWNLIGKGLRPPFQAPSEREWQGGCWQAFR